MPTGLVLNYFRKKDSSQIIDGANYKVINFSQQLYWKCTSAWVLSCEFAAYFQYTLS